MPESKRKSKTVKTISEPLDSEPRSNCQRCQAPIPENPEFPEYCDDCYSIYGSCCTEFESDDKKDKSLVQLPPPNPYNTC